MAKTFLALASLAVFPSLVTTKDWPVIGSQNRDYIGFAKVARFFCCPRDLTVRGGTPRTPEARIKQPGAAIQSSA